MSDRVGRRELRAQAGFEDRRSPATRSTVMVLVCLLVIAPGGCGGLSVREPWVRNAIEDREERLEALNHLSSASGAVLLRYDLLKTSARDPAAAARILETKLEAEPVHDGALALAELSYQAGLWQRSKSRKSAIDWYRDAAALAALALEEPTGSRPDLAVRIHNGAVARLIRASQDEAGRPGATGGRSWKSTGSCYRPRRPT